MEYAIRSIVEKGENAINKHDNDQATIYCKSL